MSRHRNSLAEGARLHWYQIRGVLGQGGFGITYLADDTNLGRRVAIKEYLPVEMAVREGDASVHPVSGEHGEQFRWGLDRFITEARTLAQFKHPNIVRVFTVFTENNTAYMVMEYEQGRPLDKLMKEHKTLPEAELKAIVMPILDGLAQVHERGFIHRDIKPPNIFIRADGSPVLLDFGSARQSLSERTRTLTAMVSPGFAPFEQYTGKSDRQGPWTDIYGLGATLYRGITGRSPADAMERSEALLQTQRDSYVPIAEIDPPGYSAQFVRAVDHAMAFRPEDRPQSIAHWRVELADEQEIPTMRADAPETAPTAAATPAGTVETIRISVAPESPPPEAADQPGASRWRRAVGPLLVVLAVVIAFALARNAGWEAEMPAATPSPASVPGADTVVTDDAEPAGPVVETPEPRTDQPSADHSAGDAAATPAGIPEVDRQRIVALERRLNSGEGVSREQLRTVLDHIENRTREAVRNRDYDLAADYVNAMLKIAPDNKRLNEALRRIEQARKENN